MSFFYNILHLLWETLLLVVSALSMASQCSVSHSLCQQWVCVGRGRFLFHFSLYKRLCPLPNGVHLPFISYVPLVVSSSYVYSSGTYFLSLLQLDLDSFHNFAWITCPLLGCFTSENSPSAVSVKVCYLLMSKRSSFTLYLICAFGGFVIIDFPVPCALFHFAVLTFLDQKVY